jgi:lysophospholipase L1-like esterase
MKGLKSLAWLPFLALLYFLVVEGFLALAFHWHQDYDVEMWKYNRLLKHSVSDPRAHVHIPGKSARLMGVEVATNSLGLRNPELGEKQAYRIAVFGDSFTLGWGVSEEETYVRALERLLRQDCELPVELINLGIGNYNTAQVAEAISRQAAGLAPDLIIYGFYWNDGEPVQAEPTGLFERNLYLSVFWRKIRMRLLARGSGFVEHYSSHFEGENWESFRTDLELLMRAANSAGAPLLAALLPELRPTRGKQVEESYRKVEEFFRQSGIPVANLAGRMESSPAYWVAADDPHPNALAQAEIAALLKKLLFPGCKLPILVGTAVPR